MTSDSETVVQNTGFLLIGEVTTRALSLMLVFAIARYLSNVGLGAYSFAFAFTDLLLNLVDLGIPLYINREMARDRAVASSYLSNVLGLRLLMAPAVLILGGLAAAAAFFLGFITFETLFITAVAILGMTLNFATEPFRSVFMSHEKGSYYSGLLIFERLLFTGTGLGLLAAGYGLRHVIAAYAFSQLVAFLTSTYLVRKRFFRFTPKLDLAVVRHIIGNSMQFWMTSLLRMISQRADIIMLSVMQGFAATGLYGAAYKITEALRLIPLVIVTASFPTMSRLHAQAKESAKLLYEKTFYYLLIAAIPAATGLSLIADRLMPFLYGPGFASSAAALKLLIWAEALIFLHYLMGFMLSAVNKQHLFTIVTATYAGANIALNFLLIPKYSFIGAAAAAVATQAVAVLMLYHFSAKSGYGISLPRLIYKPLIAAAAMAAAILAMNQLHLFLVVPAAAAVYLGALTALKGIGKEELGIVKAMIGKATKRQ
ncbi:oligosaccharide flippase family protein [Candidatus Woesearchaeota archaeon]|nr:oligosaccharide flippase family protein [Candidatus Woesearchaeota archaeon]